jgi:probable O-glycosylation ligase (exosortase A-associated)
LKGKNPIRTSVLLLILVGLAVAFMPDSWSERMETIGNYTQDSSAMSRLWTWQTLFNAAMDRPFVGVGFRADNELVFARYAPWSPEFEVFRGAVFVAHSIYFQTLGEHGFVGLLLFLSIGAMTWLTAGRTARAALQQPELASWMPLLMRMAQVSLIGYAVGGAFLSIAYLDVPYYVVGVVLLCAAMCQQRDERSSRSAAEQVPLPATAAPGPRGQLTP